MSTPRSYATRQLWNCTWQREIKCDNDSPGHRYAYGTIRRGASINSRSFIVDSHGGLLIGISIAREMDQSLAVAAGDVKGSLAWLLGGATSAVVRERAHDAQQMRALQFAPHQALIRLQV